ncbi:hypothetical protein PC116_g19773 [Phytophthora cactorum]|uniref:Uncharacterized protein n=1 Tax=Phytophthora cactorum TaxID=29920 RepID=A0A8T1K5V5_9STRA|nr:hypothetical protein PC115_g17695 [Phytophthora cactorum]KAG2989245.1 hypothetical protein PC119_g19341 [Phytophthora cactorum]KAG3165529.1 hypothetical protein C6341_g12340 [Phytophthora cactorum]KAG4059171.1 hypothetical protein PC123_g5886 [Phytophthora cactorum]KAG4231977.1 hypothetical protein PC116_g19773 [Phytophthora cactorum]
MFSPLRTSAPLPPPQRAVSGKLGPVEMGNFVNDNVFEQLKAACGAERVLCKKEIVKEKGMEKYCNADKLPGLDAYVQGYFEGTIVSIYDQPYMTPDVAATGEKGDSGSHKLSRIRTKASPAPSSFRRRRNGLP